MSRNISRHLLGLVPFLLVISNGYGNEQACESITVVDSPYLHEQIDGSLEPESIPQWLKYRMFVSRHESHVDALIQELSPTDHAILSNLGTNTEYWRQRENERYRQEFHNLCANRTTMDTVALAREYERLAAESNNRAGERVLSTINALSSSGRHTVEEYIDNTITPKLSFPRRNTVDLALKAPERARYTLEAMCYLQINGEPSPEEQKTMECFRTQLGVEANDESSNRHVAIGQDSGQ